MELKIGKWAFTLLGNTARVIFQHGDNEVSVRANWGAKGVNTVTIDGYLNHELVFIHDIKLGGNDDE